MIAAYVVAEVATSLVEVDAGLWDAARLAWSTDAWSLEPLEGMVLPVVARGGRLVLLSGFEHFLARQVDGASSVKVYRVVVGKTQSLTEHAIIFSMPRLPRSPHERLT